MVWNIADITMGLMALINIPTILILGKYAMRALKDYDKKRKAGGEIQFRAIDVGLDSEVDCWK